MNNILINCRADLKKYFLGSWQIDRTVFLDNHLVVPQCHGMAIFDLNQNTNGVIYKENVKLKYDGLDKELLATRNYEYDFDNVNDMNVRVTTMDIISLSFIVNFTSVGTNQIVGKGKYQCGDDLYSCKYLISEIDQFKLCYKVHKKITSKDHHALYVTQNIRTIFTKN